MFAGGAGGFDPTSMDPHVDDAVCRWSETPSECEVLLAIPGLRGQPAACLAIEFAVTALSVTAFGRIVWSCILRGRAVPKSAVFVVKENEERVPLIELSVRKANKALWGIGENSIL